MMFRNIFQIHFHKQLAYRLKTQNLIIQLKVTYFMISEEHIFEKYVKMDVEIFFGGNYQVNNKYH